jgi:hypothetical protein
MPSLSFTMIAFLGSCALGLGCSSGSDPARSSTPELPPAGDAGLTSAPVSSAPLSGTIFGQPFVAKSALGRFDTKTGRMSISVYPEVQPCGPADDATLKPGLSILTSVPWNRGLARDVDNDIGPDNQGVTFVSYDGHTPDNAITSAGRIEVIEAPTVQGAHGVVRLRASFQPDSVEGQLSVDVCAIQ